VKILQRINIHAGNIKRASNCNLLKHDWLLIGCYLVELCRFPRYDDQNRANFIDCGFCKHKGSLIWSGVIGDCRIENWTAKCGTYTVRMQRQESVFQTFTSLSSPADANKWPSALKQIALIASEWERPPMSSDNEAALSALDSQKMSPFAHYIKWNAKSKRSLTLLRHVNCECYTSNI
jgi:hypothetical protein